jgi:hypothetical protein
VKIEREWDDAKRRRFGQNSVSRASGMLLNGGNNMCGESYLQQLTAMPSPGIDIWLSS